MNYDPNKREQIISARYQQRRQAGKPGWTDDEQYQQKRDRLTAFLARHPLPPGGRFLELGCGAGNLTLAVARLGYEAHGIDISGEAIAWARENAGRLGLTATFHQDSVVALTPYPDDFFEVVFDGDCLWMVTAEEHRTCYSNLHRVLRPGGWLYAQAHLVNQAFQEHYPMGANEWYAPQHRCSTVEGVPMYLYWTPDSFLEGLRSAGFEIGHIQTGPVAPDAANLPFLAGNLYVDVRKPG